MQSPRRQTRRLVIAALCVAIGVILPITLHFIPGAGMTFLPMHIPILLCGMVCGPLYGVMSGFITPLLSHVLTGMPTAASLGAMMFELATYGLVCGSLMGRIKISNKLLSVWIPQIIAMLCGRLVSGAVQALIFSVGRYSLQIWSTVSFVTALPGILIQLAVIPPLVLLLKNKTI